jgi:hypothetical protein
MGIEVNILVRYSTCDGGHMEMLDAPLKLSVGCTAHKRMNQYCISNISLSGYPTSQGVWCNFQIF